MSAILIAEDDLDICVVLDRVFRRAGYTVLTAHDGEAALEIAVGQHPDVLLTDLDMPKMSGLELCRAIRVHPDLADTPVAIISGSLQPGDPRAAEATACGVLLKPFLNEHLLATIQALIDHGPHAHGGATASTCPLSALSAGR